ncbi:UvrB/UvrC motif-containing protein [Thermoanaerobacterium sp. DL9XJH110]|uniref:UvrB/UvrC motif-containing protein n=1 Tax=Thermoanaerobacterium sp. DL9XJH110 TaxID=3386643 RepID=UPI003BB602E1
MMCQECQKRPATVHITKIVNGEKSQMHLCEECAREKHLGFSAGLNPFGFDDETDFSIGKLLSSFFEPENQGYKQTPDSLKCDRCGLSFPRFTQTGRFGCSHCYDAFKGQLDPMLRRIHGKTFHVGKVPRRSGSEIRIKNELNRLKRELQEAINAEEYERAAVLRDRIKELEQKKNKE